MSYLDFTKNSFRIIYAIIFLFFSGSAYAFRGPDSGAVSDTTVFFFSIVLIIIFAYNFYVSSGFRKSVFHALFFIGLVIIFPLSLFAGDKKNWEMGMLMIPVMFLVHKFIYYILDRYKGEPKNLDNPNAIQSPSRNTNGLSEDFKNIAKDDGVSAGGKSKIPESDNTLYPEIISIKEVPPVKQNFTKPVVLKSIKEINESSNNFKYASYLSESFPSKKPFLTPSKVNNHDTIKEKEVVSSKSKDANQNNVPKPDILTIRRNQAKALFVIRIHREVTGILIKDEMLWHECMLETKNDLNSASLLYKVAREKFIAKLNLEFLNDRFGLDVVDSNLNYSFCALQSEAKKLAYSS